MTAFLCMWWLMLIYWYVSSLYPVLCHISDLFILRWIEFCMVFNAKCWMEMLYLDVRPSKLSAYTETAISHASSTSFFVLYFVSSFEMAPFAACEMIVRGGACVCVLVRMQPLCFLSFVFLHWGADAPSKFPSYFLTYTSPSALVPICWNDCTICWRQQTFCQSFCSLKEKKNEKLKKKE